MDEFWKSKAIAERYEFMEELGKGGIGTVVLALDRTLNKPVAIKVLNANLNDEDSIRFQQEGILSGRLKHENIVSVLDFGVTDTNVPYLIMEHLTGFSLKHMLSEEGKLDTLFAVQIFQQICRGMVSSHNQGVVHRDLKPGNIIMVPLEDESLAAKIVDFGLARLISQDDRLTVAGSAIGSPLYMSPEQGQGQAGDQRSDIYSMGCLMFEVLTGSVPFVGEAAVHTLMMHQSVIPERLHVRAQQAFPEVLEAIVAKCLHKSPDGRYQNFSDLLRDLENLEADIIRAEREEYLDAATRSGIQRALNSVTDFTVPLTSKMSNSEVAIKASIGLAVLALAAFVGLVFYHTSGLNETPAEPPVKRFTPRDLNIMKIEEVNGGISVSGNLGVMDVNLVDLKKYPKLLELDLSRSFCVGTGLKALKSTTTITHLDMSETQPTEEGLIAITEVNGMESLSLKDCDALKDADLAILAKCETLEDFSFGGLDLTEKSFKYLKNYPELKSVCLDEFHITPSGLGEILKIPKLIALRFQECTLDKGDLKLLEKHPGTFANLSFAKMAVTSEMFSQIEKIRTALVTLTDVKTTGPVYSRMKKDHRFVWKRLEVDGRPVQDRLSENSSDHGN